VIRLETNRTQRPTSFTPKHGGGRLGTLFERRLSDGKRRLAKPFQPFSASPIKSIKSVASQALAADFNSLDFHAISQDLTRL